MRTPAGTECPYYYEDFHRGREIQECRLIDRTPDGGTWEPGHCSNCPVPSITRANACPHMVAGSAGRIRAARIRQTRGSQRDVHQVP